MSLNGKRDNFIRDDFYSLEKLSPMFTRAKINSIIDETIEKVSNWSQLARNTTSPNHYATQLKLI